MQASGEGAQVLVLQAVLQHVPQLEEEERHKPRKVRRRRMSVMAAASEGRVGSWLSQVGYSGRFNVRQACSWSI